MGEPQTLLAKSRSVKNGRERELSVAAHCLDTASAAEHVFRDRILDAWMRFFRCTDKKSFLRDLKIACLFHDIGKANADFQAAVTSGKLQGIRHEHLSGLILCLKPIREWLIAGGCHYNAIIAAVLSHHAKVQAHDAKGDYYWALDTGRPPIPTFLNHPECKHILQQIADLVGLPVPCLLPNDPWPSPVWNDVLLAGFDSADDLEIPRDDVLDRDRNYMLAVKAATIVSDSVASGFWREDRDLDDYLSHSLLRPALTKERINADIINKRIQQLQDAGKWKNWSDFQIAADHLADRAAIIAGCGAGKTLLAWRWAAAVAERNKIGSVIFLYPTRATATEGFKDYVAWAPEADAILLTGTAALDLDGMRANPPDSMRDKNYADETDARLFALANWKKTYFSATLDQFLSFLEHGYAGICLLPQFADAAVIIDEAHSLDRHLFERLLALLTHFDVPVLIMSATLPRERAEKLRALGIQIFPDTHERAQFPDLIAEEDRLRYRLIRCANKENALSIANTSDKTERRSTLWVVNTVKRCQTLALRLRSNGINPLIYHSRFTVRDRRRVHQDVIKAFQTPNSHQWAITTQVCEMSLDLDADRLISEDAPLPSLIQRFGRSNRKRVSRNHEDVLAGKARSPDFRSEVITYQPEDFNPYQHEIDGKEAVIGTGKFAQDFHEKEIGQQQLAEALLNRQYAPDVASPQASAGFLSGGWFATARPFRGDDNDKDVRCLLSTDLAAGLNTNGMPGFEDPLDAWIINVPKRYVLSIANQKNNPTPYDRPAWMIDKHLHIADGNLYFGPEHPAHPSLGFLLIDPSELE
jgi:CRISPR-associated endonuclease/helicase Cas3